MFDLDNTLIDYAKMKKHSVSAAVDGMIDAGLKIDKKKSMNLIYELFDKYGMEYHKIFQTFLKIILKSFC